MLSLFCTAMLGAVVVTGAESTPVATIRQEPLALPTYAFSDPDPVPRTSLKRYPYFRYDGSTDVCAVKEWQAVILENAKVKVTMLPEIGGKVWGAVDKQTGHEFIYFNHAVKFRDIAMRGPWCSGGIEFNFGIVGHAPTSATPVDWCMVKDLQGNVSCFVTATEYINRTTWQIEVFLGADADHFETRTTWFNGSNLAQPYYQWMNAAYSARGKPRFYFPGANYLGHPGDAHAWPLDEKGRDLSNYPNNAFGSHKSYHVINGDASFYAVWWPESGFGSVHQNHDLDQYSKYGRKIWLWALSRSGGIWEDLLTDADGQYVELQSGRVFHQPGGETWRTPFKHPTFTPGAVDTFVERWGIARSEAELKAKCNAKNYVKRPLEMPAKFDWNSMYGHYLRGEQAVRERDELKGEEELRACLAMEPAYVPALTVQADLQCRRGRYAEARELCARALAVNTYDATANYLDGLAALALGELATAKERLGLAAFAPEYRAPASVLIAKAEMRAQNWRGVLAAAARAQQASPQNPEAGVLRAAVWRHLDSPSAALQELQVVQKTWKMWPGVRFELQQLNETTDFEKSFRNELPDQTFLELGSWYEEAGLQDEALQLFGYATNSPIARIRAAYVRACRGENDLAQAELDAAAKMPSANVFPFRRETRAPLLWAMERGKSWKFRYWAAVQLAATGEGAKADALLESVKDADEDVFFLYRASRRKGVAKRDDILKAISLKKTWRVYRDLAAWEDAEGKPADMCRAALEGLAVDPGRNPLQMAYARSLVKLGDFQGAVKYLGGIKILPSECADNAHAIWVDAWKGEEAAARKRGDTAAADRAKARAEEYPENLGAGKPFPDAKPGE